MRTVLFLTQAAAPVGGVQRWLDQLAEGLPRHGWRAVAGLAWGRFHDPARFEAAHPGLDTLRLDGRSGTRAGRLLAIDQALRRARPSAVVPVCLADGFDAVCEAKRRGDDTRLIVGAFEISAPLLLEARRHAAWVDRALGTSRLATRALSLVARLPRERVDYVPPGFSAPASPPRRAPGRALRLGLVGRLDPDKRPLDLLALLDALDARDFDYEAHVVGDGPLRATLTQAGARRLAAGRLRLHGALAHDVVQREIWPALDVGLLFSPAEGGLPNVAAEALMHGVALATADFRGRASQGLLRHEQTALVFPVGHAGAAAEAVLRLAREPGLRERLAAAGGAQVRREHSLEGMLSAWREALDAACSGPAARGVLAPRTAAGRDRLAAWLGRRAGERVRRLLGRRHVHADASEWPHFYPHDDDALREAEQALDDAARSET